MTELCFYLQGSSVSGGGETLLAHQAGGTGAAAGEPPMTNEEVQVRLCLKSVG